MTINSTLYALRSTLNFNKCTALFLFCLGFMFKAAFAQTQNNSIDAPGDVAFVAYATPSSNGCAGFAVVLLDNCPNNTSIAFSDDEWTGASFAPVAEGEIIWTNNTGATLNKGTVIKFFGGNNAWTSAAVNIGILDLTNAAGMTTSGGDQLFAFKGSSRGTVGTLLAFEGGILTGTLVFQGTPFGSGGNPTSDLVFNGTYGVNVTSAMGGVLYTGSTTCNGTIAACNAMINTQSSWTRPTGFTSLTTSTLFFAAIPNSFGGSVLPIELTQFDANTEGSKNQLTWRTESEKDNSHFDIERSTDGSTFHSIGQVKGNNKPSSYQFVDNQPFAMSYYRLRQIDFDGTETFSKIVSVQLKDKGKGLKIYPNPVSSLLAIDYTDGSDFQILNLLGQQVLTGETGQRLDVSALPQGTYILKVGAEQAKFVKQ